MSDDSRSRAIKLFADEGAAGLVRRIVELEAELAAAKAEKISLDNENDGCLNGGMPAVCSTQTLRPDKR